MSISNFLNKASNFFGLKSPTLFKLPITDGEIVFCKNNICVHPAPEYNRSFDHYPGYLTIRSHDDEPLIKTLILTWIPNSSLERNQRSLENSPNTQTEPACYSTRQNLSPKVGCSSSTITSPLNEAVSLIDILPSSPIKKRCQSSSSQEVRKRSSGSNRSVTSIEMDGDNLMVVTEEVSDFDDVLGYDLATEEDDDAFDIPHATAASMMKSRDRRCFGSRNHDLDFEDLEGGYVNVITSERVKKVPSIISSSSSSSTPTSGPDPLSSSLDSLILSTNPSKKVKHHLTLPTSLISPSCRRNQNDLFEMSRSPSVESPDPNCGIFSVDLGQMRSLRIFFSDEKCSSGQLVIASRESQYKVLHFHHGGLDKLANVFSHWTFLARTENKTGIEEEESHYQHFSVIRPFFSAEHFHPEEGTFEPLNRATWKTYMDEDGHILDDLDLRKAVFFAGIDPTLRAEVWPFLLHYYPYNTTHEERAHIRNYKYLIYQDIKKTRTKLTEVQTEWFSRKYGYTIEKDVIRTDRSHPYFYGEGNPNLKTLEDILQNYALTHLNHGYTQGMSDLLAPVLAELKMEVDAYWCFVGLMQHTIFFSSPNDIDMDGQLLYLKELLRLLLPGFHNHLLNVEDGLDLIFCHRWLLLCFKREFRESEALKVWEVCWSCYQSDYFHIFVCLAVLSIYGTDVVQQNLSSDEMLLHFNSLSMHMNADLVLKKARGLLHQFRQLEQIPCTLYGLCSFCSPGMWDSKHEPGLECIGHAPNELCPAHKNM